MPKQTQIIILIVLAQFLGTSLWFVGNIVVPQLPVTRLGNPDLLGDLLAAVQIGFILGTLVFAILAIADRFSPSKVFAVSAILGAITNLALLLPQAESGTLLISRLSTGFFLAGIYPVGMKIAADYFEKGLGKVLGFLVGALVLGTALPHFLNSFEVSVDYKIITLVTSGLAAVGGLLIGFLVADGPYRKAQQKLSINAIPFIFQTKKFRRAAFGYWGHMWELYAFWGFLPVFINYYQAEHQVYLNTSLWSFFAIAIGAISCAYGGILTVKISSKKVAFYALVISGICCLVSVFSIEFPPMIFGAFLLLWGAAVVADSPQFSTLVAWNAPPEYRGTALTLVNCIGFAITVVSIQLLNYWVIHFEIDYLFLVLSLGPIFGILSLYRSRL